MTGQVLPAFNQYCNEVMQLGFDTSQEPEIIQKAQRGDPEARAEVIAHCLRHVITLAYRYQVYVPHDGIEDIIGIGNLALVECVDKALTKKNPIGFLYGCVRNQLLTYINRRSTLIYKTELHQEIPVVPFNEELLQTVQATYERGITEEEEARLYRAIQKLTPLQKEVIAARFQLFGQQGDSLYALVRRNGRSVHHNYYDALYAALKRMKHFIMEEGATYGTNEGSSSFPRVSDHQSIS